MPSPKANMIAWSHGAAERQPRSPAGLNEAACLFEIASPELGCPGLPTFSTAGRVKCSGFVCLFG